MKLLEQLISIIAPHVCLGCGAEQDRLLCEACIEGLIKVPSCCYRCKAVTEDYSVCKQCAPSTPLRHVAVFTHYRDAGKELVHRMKYERAQQGAREIAGMVSEHLPLYPPDAVLTHIPTATSRIRTRGYDHAKIIARTLATGGIFTTSLLARIGQAHQVGSRRAERLRQLEHAFRPIHANHIQGKHVVLVDDVLTTGATLETAARVLRRAGATRVDAIVFAQA